MLHTYWEVQHFKRIEHEREIEIAKKHLRGREYPSQYDTQRASYRKTSTEQLVTCRSAQPSQKMLSTEFGFWTLTRRRLLSCSSDYREEQQNW